MDYRKNIHLIESIHEINFVRVYQLLSEGASDANSIDTDGKTSLCAAMNLIKKFPSKDYEIKKIVKTLINHGADINNTKDDQGWVPLFWSIENNANDIVEIICKIDPHFKYITDKYKRTPKQAAIQKGNVNIALTLEKHNDDSFFCFKEIMDNVKNVDENVICLNPEDFGMKKMDFLNFMNIKKKAFIKNYNSNVQTVLTANADGIIEIDHNDIVDIYYYHVLSPNNLIPINKNPGIIIKYDEDNNGLISCNNNITYNISKFSMYF